MHTLSKARPPLVIALMLALALALPSLTVYAASPPTVTGTSPSGGSVAGGTTLTILGANFTPGATVTVGGFAASAVDFSGTTKITALTPPRGAGSAAAAVTNPDAQSGTSPTTFTYSASAPAGTPAIIEFTIPSAHHAQGIAAGPDGNLWFTEHGSNVVGRLTLAPPVPPAVTAASPDSGPTTGGTTVTLTGNGFLPGATVSFGGVSAGTNVTVLSTIQLIVTAPAHPTTGAVGIVGTNPDGGIGTLAHGHTYGTSNALPGPKPPGTTGGPANPLPVNRPSGLPSGMNPNPLPPPR